MQEIQNIGVDVAKDELVVWVNGSTHTVANQAQAVTAWLRTLRGPARLAVESTGQYHQLLIQLAHQHGLVCYVLNPRDIYLYAKALGMRGKTDRSDAQVISRYLQEHQAHLHAWKPATVAEREITQLLGRRAKLVVYRDSITTSLEGLDGLEQAQHGLTEQFAVLFEAIDRRLRELLRSEPDLWQASQCLQSIPSVGPLGAAMLASLFARIAFTNLNAVVAYSGLDPRPHDSGKKRGRRRLSKRGPPALRRQLYMMAFSGSRTAVFKPYYQALRARGLSSTEAFVILARRILRIAFAVWRTRQPFNGLLNQA